MATLFPLRRFATPGKQCALIASGDYRPSLRYPWPAATVSRSRFFIAVALATVPLAALTEKDDTDLAQELTNPIANLVTIPIQMNFDRAVGPADDGSKITTNVQPVIPFDISEGWNLITRTIVPVIYQDDIFPGAESQFGLGYWAESPDSGPEGFRFRLQANIVLPKSW